MIFSHGFAHEFTSATEGVQDPKLMKATYAGFVCKAEDKDEQIWKTSIAMSMIGIRACSDL